MYHKQRKKFVQVYVLQDAAEPGEDLEVACNQDVFVGTNTRL